MTKRDLGFDHEDICGKLEIIPGFHFYITAINSKHQSSFLFGLKVELILLLVILNVNVSPHHHGQTVCSTLQLSVQQSLTSGLFPSSQRFLLLAVQCQRFARTTDRLSTVEQEATVECRLHLRSHLLVRLSQESQWF